MSLSREEVLKIANLARLQLTEEEIASYQEKLGKVLGHIKDLNSVQTPEDIFVRHVPADAESFRADASRNYDAVEAILENAPAVEERSFLLPKVIEHGA